MMRVLAIAEFQVGRSLVPLPERGPEEEEEGRQEKAATQNPKRSKWSSHF